MKTLVVYYSRTGVTRKVARMIADRLSCDLEQIEEERNRKGMVAYLWSSYEAFREKTPPIKQAGQDPAAYDLVVIGTPMWAWKMASPVRSYLAQKEASLPAVAFFCTSGGSDGAKLLQDMQEFCDHKAVALLKLKEKEVKDGIVTGKIGDFLDTLRG